jgi:hypothetical protein
MKFIKYIIINLFIYPQIFLLNLSYYISKLFAKKYLQESWVIGVDEIASNIHFFKKILKPSVSVCLEKNKSYKWDYDYSINLPNIYLRYFYRFIYAPILLGYLTNRHTHFWYIWNSGFLIDRKYEFKFLKAKNKKISCMFVGSDIRSPKLSLEYTRKINIDYFLSYSKQENSKDFLYRDFKVKQTAIIADLYSDIIFSFKLEQISYLKKKQFPWLCPYPKEKFIKNDIKFYDLKKIKIAHAPSNPLIKGTSLVRAAIKKLEIEEYDIEYIELQNIPNKVVLEHLKSAHIVLNDFYGFDINLGLLALESMANHTALMMAYDPDAIKHYDIKLEGFDKCLLNTKYWQVYDNLKYLLDNPDMIKLYADNGYEFAYKHHTYEATGKYLNKILKENSII